MRPVLLAVLLTSAGCANTVYRVEGQAVTPKGAPRSECERGEWLVVAPSRADIAPEGKKLSEPHEGLGLYRVGSEDPQNVMDHRETLGPDETFERREALLGSHDTKAMVAAGLGIAALASIGVGTGLFVSAFETEETTRADGSRQEETRIDGLRGGLGGGLVGLGFALGIAGLSVSPGHADRTRANAARYIFLSPEDDPEKVEAMVARHNATIRRRCEASGR